MLWAPGICRKNFHCTTKMRKYRCMKLFVHHFQLLRRGEEMGFAMLLHSKSSQGVFCVLAAILIFHLFSQKAGGGFNQPLVCFL